MREMGLFRGKTKEGKWVEGNLIRTAKHKDGHIHCWIKPITILGLGAISTATENFLEVIPETVGEYIGRHDKHSKKIFEGHRVKVKRYWENPEFYEVIVKDIRNIPSELCGSEFIECEIIGDAYED